MDLPFQSSNVPPVPEELVEAGLEAGLATPEGAGEEEPMISRRPSVAVHVQVLPLNTEDLEVVVEEPKGRKKKVSML